MKHGALLLVALTLLGGPTFAATLIVDPTQSGQFQTIQQAISAAVSGDEILVAQGTYVEAIDLGSKQLVIRSQSGPSLTVISSPLFPTVSTVTIAGNQDRDTVIDGFTIVPSSSPLQGAGVFCNGTSPTIQNCSFLLCQALVEGGGLYCANATPGPLVLSCTFQNNTAVNGGAIFGAACDLEVERCIFDNNASNDNGGAIWLSNTPNLVTVCNSGFFGNSADRGAAVFTTAISAELNWNTFADNNATIEGDGLYGENALYLAVDACIFWNTGAAEIVSATPPSAINVERSDVRNGSAGVVEYAPAQVIYGASNIDLDPLFDGDYRLSPGSPCLDISSWNPSSAVCELDIDGQPRGFDADNDGSIEWDMGFDELHPTFVRGDASSDGSVDLGDALRIMAYFQGTATIDCPDAADANDDGSVNVGDAVRVLNWLFNAMPLPQPYPNCGEDTTPDTLTCHAFCP